MMTVLALLMIGVRASDFRTFPLDERSLYTIRLNREEPTTCVFPAPIKAIVGANVSVKAEDNPAVLLSHEPGSDYFSVRLLKENATGALNIVLRGKVYVLAFVAAPSPDRAVVFLDEPVAGGTPRRNESEMLRGLVERAKQLDRGAEQPAGMSSRFERVERSDATAYRTFNAVIASVVRFEAEDALVFRLRLESTCDVAVPYDPQGVAIRLGREFFPGAYVEASGAIPPRGSSQVYLVVAGAPRGGRANLSVTEPFTVIVPYP
jgi:hypothetical protein